jgi:aminocarboxymuconate-semialdehyde decarboxylase
MTIDAHAHYVPRRILDTLEREGKRYGVEVIAPPACQPCVRFEYGMQIRPFFAGLLQSPRERIDAMQRIGIDRQILALWCDIFGYRLSGDKALAWHRLMNESLAAVCAEHPQNFSWLASGPLPDAARAARELERAVKQAGAVGAIIAANIDGTNPGDLPLDEFWAAAVALDVPVFIHPAQPVALPRTERYALSQVVQYTFDTTLAIGSMIGSGVLDRFPTLRILLSHGGGQLTWLIGRFDVMHAGMDRHHQHWAAERAPSDYLRRLWYDTILHDGPALRYLAAKVDIERMVLGSDDPFPPMDKDPLASLRAAGFDADEIERIAEHNPRRLFRL